MQIYKSVLIKLLCALCLSASALTSNAECENAIFKCIQYSTKKINTDTCVLEGMAFEIIENGGLNGLKATVNSGRIRIISSLGKDAEFKVIRYVFSIRGDENYSSIRNYGDLVSYPVLNLLKSAEKGDLFYFEDIIIVDQSKEILENAVKPIIIRKM